MAPVNLKYGIHVFKYRDIDILTSAEKVEVVNNFKSLLKQRLGGSDFDLSLFNGICEDTLTRGKVVQIMRSIVNNTIVPNNQDYGTDTLIYAIRLVRNNNIVKRSNAIKSFIMNQQIADQLCITPDNVKNN